MGEDKIVQFVCFETTLDTGQFVTQWELYNRSAGSDTDVTLQQSASNNGFRYLAQHRCGADQLQFTFSRAKKTSRMPEVEIKARQAGGYLVIQSERINDSGPDESKIFVFLSNGHAGLSTFQELANHGKLNIYEAYYENCQYAYILEYFVKNKNLSHMTEQLTTLAVHDFGVFKECVLLPA